jgi:excisionase family DNA binding protein
MATLEEPGTGRVLDAPGAAQLLRVSRKTVLRLAKAGELPGRKAGREWRFEVSALLDGVARRIPA